MQELLGQTIAELASQHPLIVLLDEVETLAADRSKMSLEANPVDVHRATDAVLAQLDHLAAKYPNLLFIATSNFANAIDGAFLSRADLVVHIDLPSAEARKSIFSDTLDALGAAFPDVRRLASEPNLNHLSELSAGLDGRKIRKAVLSACASDKKSALDANHLTIKQVEHAVTEAKRSHSKPEKDRHAHRS